MHDKLNLPNVYLYAFNNGKILKLKLDPSRKKGVFVIEVENIIDDEIIKFIDNNIKNGFPDMESIKAEFIVRNINYEDSVNYYSKAIENSSLTKPMNNRNR